MTTETPFKVGETYPMRGGGTFEVIAIRPELDQPIVGIVTIAGMSWLSSRTANGTFKVKPGGPHDIIPPPPPPPVIVSDEAVEAYRDVAKEFHRVDNSVRNALAAAYPIMRRDNP